MADDQVVTVARAQQTVRDEPVPARTIAITGEVPEFSRNGYMREAKVFYRQEAEKILGALNAVLPGGTLDVLFALMAQDRASVFRVSGLWGTDPAPVTGLRLYCWSHTAVHTIQLADVERIVYALTALPELHARTGAAPEDDPSCPLDALQLAVTGDLYQYVELCIGRREAADEWSLEQQQRLDALEAQRAAVLAIHKRGELGVFCDECIGRDEEAIAWPCPTAQAVGVTA